MSTNNEYIFVYKIAKTRMVNVPTLKVIVLIFLIYLFGLEVIGIVIGGPIMFWGPSFGVQPEIESLERIFSRIWPWAALPFNLIMIIFLVKRYSGHFFSGSWKINFYSNFEIGWLWSIPYIFLTGIYAFNPKVRAGWLKHYFLLHNLSQENITIIIVILISTILLIISFLEELIFRGMIQQYIKKFVTPNKSVFITAGIFTLVHFNQFFIIPVSLGGVGSLFIGGILTGFAFNKANSCISSFIPHLVYNIKYIIIVPLMLAS